MATHTVKSLTAIVIEQQAAIHLLMERTENLEQVIEQLQVQLAERECATREGNEPERAPWIYEPARNNEFSFAAANKKAKEFAKQGMRPKLKRTKRGWEVAVN